MPCCRLIVTDEYSAIVCSGDPELRWAMALCEQQQDDAEYERLLNVASWPCDQCGRAMEEDEPGIWSCMCGERYRIMAGKGRE